MPERPDLREIAGDIREALEDCDRESLVDILTYVFKEYVLEGPPPLRADEIDGLGELEGLSFAELISALQTRLDTPELGLFQVRGDQVLVRAGGTLTPIEAGEARPEPAPSPPAPPRGPAPSAPAPDAGTPAGRPTVDEAVARGRGDLAGGERGEVQAPPGRPGAAPPPSSSAAPSPDPAPGRSRSSAPPAPADSNAQPPADEGASPGGDDEAASPGDDDDASIRFSLLELD